VAEIGGTLDTAAAASAIIAVSAVIEGWETCEGSGAKSESAALVDMGDKASKINNPENSGNFDAVVRIFRIMRVMS